MSLSNANNPHVTVMHLGDVLAADVLPGAYARSEMVLVGAELINDAAIAEDGVNHITLQVKVGANIHAQLKTETGNDGAVVQNVAKSLNVLIPAIPAGSTVLLDYAEAGTVQLTGAKVMLTWHVK